MDEQSRPWHEVADSSALRSGTVGLLERLRENPALAAMAAVTAAVALAVGGVWLATSGATPSVELGPLAGETGAELGDDPGFIVVDVAGAVRAPGLYRLPAGARVGDAISAAGGFGPAVDAVAVATLINLAAPLSDGDKVVVPARGAATDQTAGGDPGTRLVDLNRASQSELEALPGIGPVTAGKIIAARTERPFRDAQELLDRGIVGRATWEKIRDLVTTG